MRKRFVVALITAVVLAVFCAIPSPLNNAVSTDGGTRVYSPILPVYKVVDWNKIHIKELDPDDSNGETTKGIQVFIFGISVYDGRYTEDGIHTRTNG